MKLLGPPVQENEELENLETEETSPAPEEAVLSELGLSDDAPEPAGKSEQEVIEEGLDNIAEGKPPEPEKPDSKEITEDDLKPLNSKNPRTNERFEKLTHGFKEAKAEVETLKTEVQRFQQENTKFRQSFEVLQKLGFADEAGAQDLIQLAQYRQVLGRGDVEAFKQIIADQVRNFESATGKKVSIQASALDQFPDLSQRVRAMELDEQTALELAHRRNVQARIERQQQERQQQSFAQQQTQQVLSQAVDQVEALQAQWQATDPDFPAILPHLQAELASIGQQFPPQQWPKVLAVQYAALKKAMVQANAQRQVVTPLRGTSRPAGRANPGSPVEAVLQELGFDE